MKGKKDKKKMEIRIKVAEGLHGIVHEMAVFRDIPMAALVKEYILDGLEKDEVRKANIKGENLPHIQAK